MRNGERGMRNGERGKRNEESSRDDCLVRVMDDG
jgi:hypothetical protein